MGKLESQVCDFFLQTREGDKKDSFFTLPLPFIHSPTILRYKKSKIIEKYLIPRGDPLLLECRLQVLAF